MAYYDPYQGMSQQYMPPQSYYPPQYYQQNSNEQLVNPESFSQPVASRSSSYDQYSQFQQDPQFSNFNGLETSSQNLGSGDDYYSHDEPSFAASNHGLHGQYHPQLQQQMGVNAIPGDSFGQGQFQHAGNLQNPNLQSLGGPQMLNNMQSQGPNMQPDMMFGDGGMASQGQQNGGGNAPSSVAPSRTVYLGNIPSDILPNELLDYVRSGILETVKILPSKNCAFISFIDHQSALLFHSDCILKKLSIKGHDVRIGWGKNSSILPAVMDAIQRDGATRNVYLGNLNNPVTGEVITEEELREDLSSYGVIDCIKIIPEKGIAFIHFLSILSAIRCVANLPLKEKYLEKKCFYGKDRCAFITKTQQHNAAQYLGLAPGMEHIVTAADREFILSALVQQSAAAAQIATQAGGANNLGNRTVYLGNLHQDSSVEEICNVVRGGLLQSIRFLKERHVCFITFIDPIAAAQFFAMCQLHGLTIHNRRIKVGWGKHSGPLSNALSLAVSNGASRNIYIGNIMDFDYYNPRKLREDFTKFGDIEQINFLEEKNCAFINFVNIANAIKAIDGIKSFNDYKSLKINFGKDRCGNLPRQFQSHGNQPSATHLEAALENASFSDNEFLNEDPQQQLQHPQGQHEEI